MSVDIDSTFEVACSQCQTTPDNYVKLDCDHKFCLVCLAYNYLQSQQQAPDDQVKVAVCSKCSFATNLDNDTIEAIQYVIKEVILPLIDQNEEELHGDYFDMKQSETIRESKTIEQPPQQQQHQELEESSPPKQQQQPQNGFYNRLLSEIKEVKESSSFRSEIASGMNERVQLYIERLDKSFKNKFESIRDIQEQKFQFEQKCTHTKEEINSETQKQIQAIEQKRNKLLSEISALESQQLQEIQKQESELEQQIQQMAKYQEELRNLKVIPEDISKFLIEIEKIMTAPSSSLQLKSSLLTSQRQLIRISSQIQLIEERLTSDSHFVQPRLSPIKNERVNELWQKLNDSDRKSRLKESSLSIDKSNQKSRWKETILEIFDKKDQSFERYSTNKNFQMNRAYNIHQVLNMQQQSFQIQKQNLLKR